MICVKCKEPLEEGARFCGSCGVQQPGAVIPQAAVRTGAKTLFQGSGGKGDDKPVAPLAYASTLADEAGAARAKLTPAALSGAASKSEGRMRVPTPPPLTLDSDLTGRVLNNRYQVEAKIGEGGFGAVYRATQTQMNRKVALKVLHARMARDQQVVGRFRREAQASSLLRAPHTVQVYDFDQTPEGVMYLAMEMLQGRSLHHILALEGPLGATRLVKVLDGIADSLGEAHAQGIVHRDIKPENVFLESRPEPDFVKVLDFGIAKIVSGEGMASGPALTAAGQTLGTLEYMSPEQLMGAQLDGRSDLYAVGILAYEMLTGQLPFAYAKTPGEMITAHLKTVPPPPSQAAPGRGIPPLLDQVVLKLLAKKREERYRDTTALRLDLKRLVDGERGQAAHPTPAASPRAVQLGTVAPSPVAPVAPSPAAAPRPAPAPSPASPASPAPPLRGAQAAPQPIPPAPESSLVTTVVGAQSPLGEARRMSGRTVALLVMLAIALAAGVAGVLFLSH